MGRRKGLLAEVGAGLREVVGGTSRTQRANPWPRCPVHQGRVPELCPECRWCPACCLGHDDEDDE